MQYNEGKVKPRLIICDWNRTIFPDYYEETFFNSIFIGEFFHAVLRGKIKRAVILVRTGLECKKMFRLAKNSGQDKERQIKEILRLLNDIMIKTLPVFRLYRYRDRYIEKVFKRVDTRLLNPLKRIKQKEKILLGIISSGYKDAIEGILKKNGYEFDFVLANDFTIAGDNVVSFRHDILLNKAEILSKVLVDRGIKAQETMYIGDDRWDADCFAKVGFPVVSFMAEEANKKIFMEQFSAFTPRDQSEWENFLENIFTNLKGGRHHGVD